MLYILIKYITQHGEEEKKQKPSKLIQYLASEPIKPGHTFARDQCCPQQAVLRSVMTLNYYSTLTRAQ